VLGRSPGGTSERTIIAARASHAVARPTVRIITRFRSLLCFVAPPPRCLLKAIDEGKALPLTQDEAATRITLSPRRRIPVGVAQPLRRRTGLRRGLSPAVCRLPVAGAAMGPGCIKAGEVPCRPARISRYRFGSAAGNSEIAIRGCPMGAVGLDCGGRRQDGDQVMRHPHRPGGIVVPTEPCDGTACRPPKRCACRSPPRTRRQRLPSC
jgi:hypothetical protein